jgi:CDP-diglyceride synthetase
MNFITNTLIGIGAFSVIAGTILIAEYILSGIGFTSEQIGTGLMIGAFLIIAPLFGDLTRSVFKLNK